MQEAETRKPPYAAGRALLLGITLIVLAAVAGDQVGRQGREEVGSVVRAAPHVSADPFRERRPEVDAWVEWLRGPHHDEVALWLRRSGRYAPLIRTELRRRGMPEALVYLVMIESGFTPEAYSRAHASGLWQFIAETGRRYGLEISRYIDERRDPVASTTAALNYLQDLYGRFGSWFLAAAAYNSGENRVERVLREHAGGERGADSLFWTIAPHLPKETRDYVPLMLAAARIGREPARYGFDDVKPWPPLTFEEVPVPGHTDLAALADRTGIPVDSMRELNPHLVRGVTPPDRPWMLRVPVGAGARVAATLSRALPGSIAVHYGYAPGS